MHNRRTIGGTARPLPQERRDDAAVRRMEGELSDERREVMALRNGGEIEIGMGQAYLGILQGLQSKEPGKFQSLVDHARGAELPKDARAWLSSALVLRPDGTLLPGLLDVLRSAYRETPEGSVLVNPFRIDTPVQRETLQRAEAKTDSWIVREILRRNDDMSGPSPD